MAESHCEVVSMFLTLKKGSSTFKIDHENSQPVSVGIHLTHHSTRMVRIPWLFNDTTCRPEWNVHDWTFRVDPTYFMTHVTNVASCPSVRNFDVDFRRAGAVALLENVKCRIFNSPKRFGSQRAVQLIIQRLQCVFRTRSVASRSPTFTHCSDR